LSCSMKRLTVVTKWHHILGIVITETKLVTGFKALVETMVGLDL